MDGYTMIDLVLFALAILAGYYALSMWHYSNGKYY